MTEQVSNRLSSEGNRPKGWRLATKIDTYTKVILTIIAVCLLWLSIGGPSMITVAAQDDRAQRVVVAGWADGSGYVRPMTSESPAITVRLVSPR